jgi:alkylhydroperoxidase/carboxymuconolactone decarboxylase family protein YurZ
MKKVRFIILPLALLSFIAACTRPGQTATNTTANYDIGVLTVTQQGIVPIASFAASGNLENLKTALHEGLNAGMTVNEIKEVLVQVYAYAGFPRSLNAINTFIAVMAEREKNGITDTMGDAGTPLDANVNKYDYGERVQTELIGGPNTAAYNVFAPAIGIFLKEHLFADIFGRGVLTYQDRQITTVSILSNIPGVNAQLRSHFNVSMNIGVTEAQLRAVIALLEIKAGKSIADNANDVFSSVIEARR